MTDISLTEAMEFAATLHDGQYRKASKVPYIAHPYEVAWLVMSHGGDAEQIAAGLLHDVIEDCSHKVGGAEAMRLQLASRFGARVLRLVEACTDTDLQPKPPWRERKEAFIARMGNEQADVLLVCCCDKLHNIRSLYREYIARGEALWDAFNSSPKSQVWYYRAMANLFLERQVGPAARALRDGVDLLEERLASGPHPSSSEPRPT